MKKIIYISGPITGTTDFEERFQAAEDMLLDKYPGAEIKNPVKFCAHLPKGSTWDEYMAVCIPEVEMSTHMHLLDGWEWSKGAYEERSLAVKMMLEFL